MFEASPRLSHRAQALRQEVVELLHLVRAAEIAAGKRGRALARVRRLGLVGPSVARKPQQNDGSAAELRANSHRPAVQLGQRFGDGEAEARALMALGELALDLLERASELGERLLRNADA